MEGAGNRRAPHPATRRALGGQLLLSRGAHKGSRRSQKEKGRASLTRTGTRTSPMGAQEGFEPPPSWVPAQACILAPWMCTVDPMSLLPHSDGCLAAPHTARTCSPRTCAEAAPHCLLFRPHSLQGRYNTVM